MLPPLSVRTQTIIFGIFTLLLLGWRYGYSFGGDDQGEILMLTLAKSFPALYPHDLFVQSVRQMPFHERAVAVFMLQPFVHILPLACLVLHLLSAFGLIIGLFRLLQAAGFSRPVAAVSIWLALLLLADRIVGADTLYYPYFQLSLLADALLANSLADFFCGRYKRAAWLMSLAGVLHPVEVFFPAAVLSLWWLCSLIGHRVSRSTAAYWFITVLSGAGVTALMLAYCKGTAGVYYPEFNRMFIAWRHPHHYFFFSQPENTRFPFLLIALLAGFWGNAKTTAGFFLRTMLLLWLAFLLFSMLFPLHSLNLLQPFKMAKWIHLLGIAAGVSFCFQRLQSMPLVSVGKPLRIAGLCLLFMLCWIFWRKDHLLRHNRLDFMAGPQRADEIDVSVQAKKITAVGSLFVVPPAFSAFPYYSQRSSYVSFKANPKSAAAFQQWVVRLGEVYGIDTTLSETGFHLLRPAEAAYQRADSSRLSDWKKKGVTHMIRALPGPEGVQCLYQNNRYGIYRL